MVNLFLYPGMLTTLVLGWLFGLLANERIAWRPSAWRQASMTTEGVLGLASLLAAGVAPALLPFPFTATPMASGWVWTWALVEAAFLLPLLPALSTPSPLVARAAIREAQIGVGGRAVLWLALGLALTSGRGAGWLAISATLMALAGAALALPIALGAGPFAAETGVTPGGSDGGLTTSVTSLFTTIRTIRAAALVAIAAAALVPTERLGTVSGLGLVSTLFLLGAWLLGRIRGRWVRLPLPVALRFCWFIATPLVVAAVGLWVLEIR